jgi:hypothetical protein
MEEEEDEDKTEEEDDDEVEAVEEEDDNDDFDWSDDDQWVKSSKNSAILLFSLHLTCRARFSSPRILLCPACPEPVPAPQETVQARRAPYWAAPNGKSF